MGLAAWLLGLEDADRARLDPARGGLFENLVISDVAKWYANRVIEPDLSFYRDSNGNEVDLLCRRARALVPIEVKSAATFSPHFVSGIERFRAAVGGETRPGVVLYAGEGTATVRSVRAFSPFRHHDHWEALQAELFPPAASAP